MKKSDVIKGFLIRPIMEILKAEHNMKSPSPLNLIVVSQNDEWIIQYKSNRSIIDFSNDFRIQELILEIKNKPIYEKV